MSVPRWQEPNLARAPFVNERPVRRLAISLWLLLAMVVGTLVWQSLSIRRETATRVAELTRLSTETVSARERAVQLEAELRRADLPAQNVRAEFLNRRLAERTFSWSNLLETVAQAMPRGVRLMRLAPEGFASERRRGGANAPTVAKTRVALRISGEAEETEALLEFVDRLYQHPAFEQPNLSRESEKKDFKIQFDLTAAYLPEVALQLAGATPGAAGAAASGDLARGPSGAASAPPAASAAAAAPSGGVPRAAAAGAAPGGAAAPADAARSATKGNEVAPTRPQPARPAAGASARTFNAHVEPEEPEEPEAAESRGPATARPLGGPGGSLRPGASAPAAGAPPAVGGPRFPANVMPTPLRPYASTTGGGQ